MGAFDGKSVLITGASAGIGQALAREFARQGADVALVARRIDRLKALEAEIRALGRRAIAVEADVTRDGDLEHAVGAAIEALGGVDVAVANAGFGVAGRAEDLKLDDYRRQFETNVFGVLRTFYAALPELKRTRGRFVAVSSVSGHLPTPSTSAYCASKFAVRGFMESIVEEMRPHGVSVTLISPGFVESEIRRIDNKGRLREDVKDPVPAWLVMPVEKAARKIVRAVARRRREAVITGHGKLGVFLYRHFPGLVNLVLRFGGGGPKRRSFKQDATAGP